MADDLKVLTPSQPLTTVNDSLHIKTSDTTPKRTQKIKLNVGGEYFVTYLDTLLRFDESYFVGLIRSGREPDEDGAYFIDRDPVYFRKILNYMRTGFLEEGHGTHKQTLQLELGYYGIPKPTLLQQYERVFNGWMPELTDITVEWDSNEPSTSLDECLKYMLETPTIVIAETDEGEVFGGYSEGWTSHRTCWPDKSWLFNLSNASGLPAMQFYFTDLNSGTSPLGGRNEAWHKATETLTSICFGHTGYRGSYNMALDFRLLHNGIIKCQTPGSFPIPQDPRFYFGDKGRPTDSKTTSDHFRMYSAFQVHLQVWKLHLKSN